jgi:hypothetical protein
MVTQKIDERTARHPAVRQRSLFAPDMSSPGKVGGPGRSL